MKNLILLSVFCLVIHTSGVAQRTKNKLRERTITAKDVNALTKTVLYVINDSIAGTDKKAFTEIKPIDIKSIKIISDPEATAAYGSRGVNGVILITTKANQKKIPVSGK